MFIDLNHNDGGVLISARADEMEDLVTDFEDALASPGEDIVSTLLHADGPISLTVRCEGE